MESEHLKLRNFTINIPKYRSSLTQDNVRPSRVEILAQLIPQRGPIPILYYKLYMLYQLYMKQNLKESGLKHQKEINKKKTLVTRS